MDFEGYISDRRKIAKKFGKPLGLYHGGTLLLGHYKSLPKRGGLLNVGKNEPG
jgi:hypothetical protein